MKNSKTDAVDTNTLAEYAERMDLVAWTGKKYNVIDNHSH